MSSAEGRQSPPPETQTGAQLKDTPASGQGIQETPNKAENLKQELNNLPSNPPKGAMSEALDEKFSKTMEPSTGQK